MDWMETAGTAIYQAFQTRSDSAWLKSPIKRNRPARTSGLNSEARVLHHKSWNGAACASLIVFEGFQFPTFEVIQYYGLVPLPLATSHFVTLPRVGGQPLDSFFLPQGPFKGEKLLYTAARPGRRAIMRSRVSGAAQSQLHEWLWLAPVQTLFRFGSIYHKVSIGFQKTEHSC